jgi:hypothetical protein
MYKRSYDHPEMGETVHSRRAISPSRAGKQREDRITVSDLASMGRRAGPGLDDPLAEAWELYQSRD